MKRVQILGVCVVMIVLISLLTFFSTVREPEYQGQTLSEWLARTQAAYYKSTDQEHPENDPAYRECKIAINKMGTNCIPFLFSDLLAGESKTKQKISAFARQPVIARILPQKWAESLRMVEANNQKNALQSHLHALFGFGALQGNAKSAEPALMRLTADTDRDKHFWGFCALCETMPSKEIFLPVATRLMKDSDEEIRITAAASLQHLYPEEAEKAGVYKLFPELQPSQTNHVIRVP